MLNTRTYGKLDFNDLLFIKYWLYLSIYIYVYMNLDVWILNFEGIFNINKNGFGIVRRIIVNYFSLHV